MVISENEQFIHVLISRSDYTAVMTRPSFREQVLRVREDAIVSSVNRLLAEKGFEAMTVDEVAADVGIAKASLYKHFDSKEDLAGAAMVKVLDQALAEVDRLGARTEAKPLDQLKAVTAWALKEQLAGRMPSLPSQSSSLRSALLANRTYIDRVIQLSDRLGEWIAAAQAAGELAPDMPGELVLYTLYARACDPVLGVLKAGGNFDDEQIVRLVLATCFDGLARRNTAS
jgi:TetR/AcrR family transcriptional regulator, regulator of autoinduction and epiphytic fitness